MSEPLPGTEPTSSTIAVHLLSPAVKSQCELCQLEEHTSAGQYARLSHRRVIALNLIWTSDFQGRK